MAKLIYSAITSLDGYVADANGKFDWSAPDEEVHTFVNDLERPIGIYLYGRRMYEVMVYWETVDAFAEQPPYIQDYARIWQAADKVVYSRTLDTVSSAKTRIAEHFDPTGIRQLKEIAERDITIGGAHLAGQAMKAGLVDEFHFLVSPVVVGGGYQGSPGRGAHEPRTSRSPRFFQRRRPPPLPAADERRVAREDLVRRNQPRNDRARRRR